MKFYELAIGAEFTAWGQSYRKIGMSMAQDEQHCANVFMGETEVITEMKNAECRMQSEGAEAESRGSEECRVKNGEP